MLLFAGNLTVVCALQPRSPDLLCAHWKLLPTTGRRRNGRQKVALAEARSDGCMSPSCRLGVCAGEQSNVTWNQSGLKEVGWTHTSVAYLPTGEGTFLAPAPALWELSLLFQPPCTEGVAGEVCFPPGQLEEYATPPGSLMARLQISGCPPANLGDPTAPTHVSISQVAGSTLLLSVCKACTPQLWQGKPPVSYGLCCPIWGLREPWNRMQASQWGARQISAVNNAHMEMPLTFIVYS